MKHLLGILLLLLVCGLGAQASSSPPPDAAPSPSTLPASTQVSPVPLIQPDAVIQAPYDYCDIQSVTILGEKRYYIYGTYRTVNLWAVAVYWWPEILSLLLGFCFLLAVRSLIRHSRPRTVGHWHCRKCNYDLTGSTSSTCPECGANRNGRGQVLGTRRGFRLAVRLVLCISLGAASALLWFNERWIHYFDWYANSLPRELAMADWIHLVWHRPISWNSFATNWIFPRQIRDNKIIYPPYVRVQALGPKASLPGSTVLDQLHTGAHLDTWFLQDNDFAFLGAHFQLFRVGTNDTFTPIGTLTSATNYYGVGSASPSENGDYLFVSPQFITEWGSGDSSPPEWEIAAIPLRPPGSPIYLTTVRILDALETPASIRKDYEDISRSDRHWRFFTRQGSWLQIGSPYVEFQPSSIPSFLGSDQPVVGATKESHPKPPRRVEWSPVTDEFRTYESNEPITIQPTTGVRDIRSSLTESVREAGFQPSTKNLPAVHFRMTTQGDRIEVLDDSGAIRAELVWLGKALARDGFEAKVLAVPDGWIVIQHHHSHGETVFIGLDVRCTVAHYSYPSTATQPVISDGKRIP